MSQQELLTRVLLFLSENRIDYMTTGSVVSSIQGEPRATHDIDIVVDLKKEGIGPLANTFPPPRYYLSTDAAKEAVVKKSMFNLLDTDTGDKVDFWLLTNDPFDQQRFKRRYEEILPGFSLFVSSPEDTILMKLRWSVLSGGSQKQFDDARSVYELQFENLDLAYLQEWVFQLHLQDLWLRLVNESNPIR
jgi:hypothetical protein